MIEKADTNTPKKYSMKMLVLLLLCSLFIFLCTMEIGVRILFPDLMEASRCYTFHADRYWTLKPDSHTKEYFRSLAGKIDSVIQVSISSQGLRDHNYAPKARGEYRIMILGDSFVYGKGVEGCNTIPKQLERVFVEDHANNISVINGGIEGYGPWQERYFLGEIGFSLSPDLVILGICLGNDVQDTMRRYGVNRRNYFLEFENSQYLLANRDKWNYAFESHLRRHWHTLVACTRFFGFPQPGLLSALLEANSFPPANHPINSMFNLGLPTYMELELCEYYPELEAGFRLMMNDIVAIQRDCANNEIPFIVFSIPIQETVYDRFWPYESGTHYPETAFQRQNGLKRFREATKENNLPYIPVSEALVHIDQESNLYIPTHGHLNEDGCQFVAEVIYKELTQRYPELLHTGKQP